MRYLVLLLSLYSGGASAVEFKLDRELAATLIAIDWMQTREIAKYPYDQHQEGQIYKIIGVNPTKSSVNWFFTAKMAAHYGINYYGSGVYLSAYNWISVVGILRSVIINKRLGLRISF